MTEKKPKKEIPRDHTWVWENIRKGNFGFLIVISAEHAVVTHINASYGKNGSWNINDVVQMTPQERSTKNVHGDFATRALKTS
jgi:hypothetical protein